MSDDSRYAFPGDLGLPTFKDVCDSRRRKTCFLPENALLNCLVLNRAMPGDVLVKLSLNVPVGTMITARSYSVIHQAECLTLVNPAWPELAAGERGEVLEVTATYVTVKIDETRFGMTDQPLLNKGGVEPLVGSKLDQPSCSEKVLNVEEGIHSFGPTGEAPKGGIVNKDYDPNPLNKSWRDREPLL